MVLCKSKISLDSFFFFLTIAIWQQFNSTLQGHLILKMTDNNKESVIMLLQALLANSRSNSISK